MVKNYLWPQPEAPEAPVGEDGEPLVGPDGEPLTPEIPLEEIQTVFEWLFSWVLSILRYALTGFAGILVMIYFK